MFKELNENIQCGMGLCVCDASSKLSHLGLEKRRTDFEVDGGNLFQEKLQDTQSSQATSIS
jgi:hypothetical protein